MSTKIEQAQEALLEMHRSMDTEVAKKIGVSRTAVSVARKRLEGSGAIPPKASIYRSREVDPSASWLPVVGWEGCYEVSDHGDVRNVRTGHVLKQRLSVQLGYVQHYLSDGARIEYAYAHRLVARAFIGEPTGPLVRHLDDVKHNNHVSNLAYGDHVDNARDAIRNGLMA